MLAVPDGVELLLSTALVQLHVALTELAEEEELREDCLRARTEAHESELARRDARRELLLAREETSRLRNERSSQASEAVVQASEGVRLARLEADELRTRLLTAESELSTARMDLAAMRTQLGASRTELAAQERVAETAREQSEAASVEISTLKTETYGLASRLLDEETRRRKAERSAAEAHATYVESVSEATGQRQAACLLLDALQQSLAQAASVLNMADRPRTTRPFSCIPKLFPRPELSVSPCALVPVSPQGAGNGSGARNR